MRVAALVSGGKDSCYSMMQCVAAGHALVALANLRPAPRPPPHPPYPHRRDELDSYMFQTVGHQGVELYAEAMGLPLYRQNTDGIAFNKGKTYEPTADDEVEDLYRLLSRVKDELQIEGVAVGAILSDYQRIRVENVCIRLGLVSLAYLWRRNQVELLQEMITSGLEAIIIKVAALGLDAKVHLGMSIRDIQPHLLLMKDKYGLNVCGEGGEYETFTLDCPLFRKKLVVDEKELILVSDDPVASVGYVNLKLHLEPKPNVNDVITLPPSVKNSFDFVSDLNDSVYSDMSDIELSETEIDTIERLEKDETHDDRTNINPLLVYDEKKIVRSASLEVPVLEHRERLRTESGDLSLLSSSPTQEFDFECERHPIADHSCIFGNSKGWYYIGGIVGEGSDCGDYTEDAMKKLCSVISSKCLELTDICSVNLYVRDMSEYAELNKVYSSYFNFPNPPTRVCVQCPLPSNVGLIIDAVAHKPVSGTDDSGEGALEYERSTMHVQSISHWAPANIGPYSQAVKVNEIIGTCGQIALVPGAMRLVEGGARRQCMLALRHVGRVLRAAHTRTHIRSVVQGVCYVTRGSAVAEARRQLERRTAGAIVEYAVVSALPRGAAVEWHAWAHTNNNRFDYEETGCNVGDYKVAICRRWNYENTVAAFVCYIATGSSPSTCQLTFSSEEACHSHRSLAAMMGAAELAEVLEYSIKKLLTEEQKEEPVINLRVFYQVWSAPPVDVILASLHTVRARSHGALVFTVVPVHMLHNAFTFISISGMRQAE